MSEKYGIKGLFIRGLVIRDISLFTKMKGSYKYDRSLLKIIYITSTHQIVLKGQSQEIFLFVIKTFDGYYKTD